jgi:hypothetical protein
MTPFTCTIRIHNFNGFADEVITIVADAWENKKYFTDETVVALIGLGQTIRKIRARLMNEGYVLSEGRLVKKEKYEH